jgi:hypothetical protein
MALYSPSSMSPYLETRDMSKQQIFTATIEEAGSQGVDFYQLFAYKVSDNSLLYDSTKITLATKLYDNEILEVTIPLNTITYIGDIKWNLRVWSGVQTVISPPKLFTNNGTPTLTINITETINTQYLDAIGIFTHPQIIGIKYFKFILYNSDGITISQETTEQYSGNIKHRFEGFDNGQVYKIKCIVEDENNIITESPLYQFSVTYSQPNVDIRPKAFLNKSTSGCEISWSNAEVNVGNQNGATIEYIKDFTKGNTINNNGLWIKTGSIYFDVNIPKDFTIIYNVDFKYFTSGLYGQLTGANGENYKLGYDGTRFYFDNHGVIQYQTAVLNKYQPYQIIIQPTEIFIREQTIYGLIKNLAKFTIEQLGQFTVEQLQGI